MRNPEMDSLKKLISLQEATGLRSAFEVFPTKNPNRYEGDKGLERNSQWKSKTTKVIRMGKAGVGVRVMGKMCADVFTNSSMGEGMGVDIFEMVFNFSTDFKAQFCYRTQTV